MRDSFDTRTFTMSNTAEQRSGAGHPVSAVIAACTSVAAQVLSKRKRMLTRSTYHKGGDCDCKKEDVICSVVGRLLAGA